MLWEKYQLECNQMRQKNTLKMQLLWHGTNKTAPELIYSSLVGFDLRMGRPDGMWGQAIYFAQEASYSLNFYAYEQSGSKQIFLAEVLTGDHVEWPQDQSLKKPPVKKGSKDEYDSVKGFTRGSMGI